MRAMRVRHVLAPQTSAPIAAAKNKSLMGEKRMRANFKTPRCAHGQRAAYARLIIVPRPRHCVPVTQSRYNLSSFDGRSDVSERFVNRLTARVPLHRAWLFAAYAAFGDNESSGAHAQCAAASFATKDWLRSL
jgi:hypothetical protein